MNEPSQAVKLSASEKPYYAGVDIVKILAAFFVVCIHFYLYNGFYYVPIDEEKYMLPIAMRWVVYSCVPIFMIATGYLMKNKKLEKGYYKGLIKIVAIYIVISVICMVFDHKHFGTEFTPWSVLRAFLEFSGARYGWYVNYYVVLYLLIPYLNLSFNGLKNHREKFMLVVFVTAFSLVARSLFIGTDRNDQIRLLPDYLAGIWPLAYYFIGAYIREYPVKDKQRLPQKIAISLLLVSTVYLLAYSTYIQSYNDVDNDRHMVSWHFNDYGTYPVMIIAVCIFVLLHDIKTTNSKVKFVLRHLSGATLGTYLISYVFDNNNYLKFNAKYPEMRDKLSHWYEIVLKNFFLSLACALVIHTVYDLIAMLLRRNPEPVQIAEAAENSEISDNIQFEPATFEEDENAETASDEGVEEVFVEEKKEDITE